VHQLERRPGIGDDRIVAIATGPDEPPVAERRPEALATEEDQPADLGHRSREVRIERGPPIELGRQEGIDPAFDAIGDHSQADGCFRRHDGQVTAPADGFRAC